MGKAAAVFGIREALKAHQSWLAIPDRGGRADFSGLTLNDADFQPGPWDRATFDRAVLIEANFSGCSLTGASFVQARLESSILTGADLSSANLMEVQMGSIW